MLARSQARARRLGRAVDLRVGDAQRLPFLAASFDTVLATLTLCSMPDEITAVAEMARVLRPRGRLVLLDRVASPSPAVRRTKRLLEPLFLCLAEDHLLRQPEHAVGRAGLVIEDHSRSRLGLVLRLTAASLTGRRSAPRPSTARPRRHLGQRRRRPDLEPPVSTPVPGSGARRTLGEDAGMVRQQEVEIRRAPTGHRVPGWTAGLAVAVAVAVCATVVVAVGSIERVPGRHRGARRPGVLAPADHPGDR